MLESPDNQKPEKNSMLARRHLSCLALALFSLPVFAADSIALSYH